MIKKYYRPMKYRFIVKTNIIEDQIENWIIQLTISSLTLFSEQIGIRGISFII